MTLEVIEYIKNNPNWKITLSKDPYCITINEDDNYYLLKYSQLFSDFRIDMVKECRGLIIDKETYKPLALSFTKFFNVFEEFAAKVNWKHCAVQEKVDGSKMLVWYDRDSWHVSTSGTIDAYKAIKTGADYSFGQLFDEAIDNLNITKQQFFDLLKPKYCYTFELISPKARVVIPYLNTEIRYIGLRDVETFEEVDPDIESQLTSVVKRPKQYNLTSLKECLKATEMMGYDEEGFVVVDDKWNRVKIKSPAYVAAHYLKNNGVDNNAKILEMIDKGEESEFLSYFPEMKDSIINVKTKKEKYITDAKEAIIDMQSHNFTDRKEIAQFINSRYPQYRNLMFRYLGTDLIAMYVDNCWNAMSIDKKLESIGLRRLENDTDKTNVEEE